MNKTLRYLWLAFAIILVLVPFTLIPAAGSGLQEEDTYLPFVRNSGDAPTPTPIPTNTPSPTNTPTITNTPSPTLTPSQTPTNTPIPSPTEKPSPAPSGDVRITLIYFDGFGSQEPDEYVQIENFDAKPIQLEGWTVRDLANHVFIFPSFVMESGKVCRVYTNEIHSEWCGFSYGSGSAIWNNGGDCAELRNSGESVIDTRCY